MFCTGLYKRNCITSDDIDIRRFTKLMDIIVKDKNSHTAGSNGVRIQVHDGFS